jgi:site-specific DNA-methyltransferase (adenine-specific)
MIDLIKGDCLEVMKGIKSGSIDAIICDPPYGTTACKWDSVIDFELMWEQLNRIIKPNGAILLFSAQPFTSALIMSNIKNYKYNWVWDKKSATGGQFARKQPMRRTEDICLFYEKQCVYNPQLEDKEKKYIRYIKKDYKNNSKHISNTKSFSTNINTRTIPEDKKYPSNIISISKGSNKKKVHPTQKPIELMEYLIKTYTNEGETVLDFTMGSGSTGVAANNLNRNFIGIEQDEKYFNIAKDRINEE